MTFPFKFFLQLCKCNEFFRLYSECNDDGSGNLLDSPLKFLLRLCKSNHLFRLCLERYFDGNGNLSWHSPLNFSFNYVNAMNSFVCIRNVMMMEVVICLDSPLKFLLQLCKCNHFFQLYLLTNVDRSGYLSCQPPQIFPWTL